MFNYDLDAENWNKAIKQYSCAHKNCTQCHGTGRKSDGSLCIHMTSCNCNKCRPQAVWLTSMLIKC